MNTQNTPVHIRLWNKDFWLLVVAEMFICTAVCTMLPTLPKWMLSKEMMTPEQTGLAMGVFGVGLYVMGGLCSWLVQRYRRNVVCMWAVVALALDMAVLWYADSMFDGVVELWVILLLRLLLGVVFGLAIMVLTSTLIIDTCESAQRTEANYSASWFSRFALSIGPMVGLLVYDFFGFSGVLIGAIGCAVVALILIKSVTFPFRAPEEGVHVFSLDRFFLPHGMVLFINLLFVSTVVGLLLSMPFEATFYALMMAGFLLALLAQRFVFRDAELKSEVISGKILLLAALLILLTNYTSPVAPVLIGIGGGLISSRFLLFFIKLSRHCQRGTSQSTYFLGWETGMALGLGLGYCLFSGQPSALLYTAIAMTAISLLMYHFFTHSWFVRNKNR
jgi:MFS family permease